MPLPTNLTALVLAAGLGTRLGKLTQHTPKALAPIADTSLLAFNLNRLKNVGISKVIVNVHHYAEQITEYLKKHDHFGLEIQISDERKQLMDTGGGILQALPLVEANHHLLVHNVDIISNFPLSELVRAHLASRAAATLLVRNRKSSRKLYFNQQMQLTAWEHLEQKNKKIIAGADLSASKPLAFGGIHVINPEYFRNLPVEPCSIIDLYLQLAPHEKIMGHQDHADVWLDVGKPDQLKKASHRIRQSAFWNEPGL